MNPKLFFLGKIARYVLSYFYNTNMIHIKWNNFKTILVIIILNSSILLSQKDLKGGYIITANNDTLHGFIDLKSNKKNSETCKFFKSLDADPVMYTPEEIKEYKIEDSKYYISKEIEIEDQPKKVFLEFLVEGIVSLYCYKSTVEDYYFIEKEGKLYPLTNELKEITDEKDDLYQKRSNAYKGILNLLFNDSPEVRRKIPNTVFEYKPLIKITEDYHHSVCTDLECINYTKNHQLKLFIEPYAGLTLSQMTLKNSDNYMKDQFVNVGSAIRFSFAKIHYLWNYIIGINYSSPSYNGVLKHTSSVYDDYYYIDLKYSMIRIPIIAEYSFPFEKLQPSVFLGYNNIFILHPECIVVQVEDYSSTPLDIILNTAPNQPIRKYQYGLTSGVGIKYHISDKSFIHLNSSYEFRIPDNSILLFDFQRVSSIYINMGFAFSIN